MEISKDGSKIEEKLVTRKRGSYDQFLAKIKFLKHGHDLIRYCPGCGTWAG
jgi:hypothetical protein